MNGLDQCVLKLAGAPNAGGCPGVDYCDCNGVYVKPQPTTSVQSATSSGGSPITTTVPDCNYIIIEPTAQDCPLTTASILSASSASAPTTTDPPVTGLPALPSSPVCSTRQDKGNGVCPQIIVPNPSSTPCPPLTTSGQICSDLTTLIISTQPTTIVPPDPMASSLSCGELYGTGTNSIETAAPSLDTSWILDRVVEFCTPTRAKDQQVTLERGKPFFEAYKVPHTDGMLIQIDLQYNSDPACSGPSVPTPTIKAALEPSGKNGPDYWCQQHLNKVTNGCDTAPGQAKAGGCVNVDCATWCWIAFTPKH